MNTQDIEALKKTNADLLLALRQIVNAYDAPNKGMAHEIVAARKLLAASPAAEKAGGLPLLCQGCNQPMSRHGALANCPAADAVGLSLDARTVRVIHRAVRYLKENDCTGPASDLQSLLDSPTAADNEAAGEPTTDEQSQFLQAWYGQPTYDGVWPAHFGHAFTGWQAARRTAVMAVVHDQATVDKHLDAVLRASGSALRHYSMQKTLDGMRAAMRDAMKGGA